jgi:penicillin-binding protein 1A
MLLVGAATSFNGYNRQLVASVWTGFDGMGTLGRGEEGAAVAVPVWMHFMREALRGVPENRRGAPDGIIEMKVNALTGGKKDADLDPIFEYFRADMLPTGGYVGDSGAVPGAIDTSSPDAPQPGSDPIF